MESLVGDHVSNGMREDRKPTALTVVRAVFILGIAKAESMMMRSLVYTCFLFSVCLLSQTGCQPPTTSDASSTAKDASSAETKPATNASNAEAGSQDAIELKEVDHEKYLATLKDLRGSIVVVDMWATWCPPCVREFPNLIALSKKYPDKIRCVSLCLDHQGIDPIEDVRKEVMAFLQKHDAKITNLLSTEEADVLLEKLSAKSIPVVEVYNAEGELIKRFDQSSGKDFNYGDVEVLVAVLAN